MIHAPWLSGLRAVATTGHPSRANLSAIARPIPDEQPVTRTVREMARGAGMSVMERPVLSSNGRLVRGGPRETGGACIVIAR